MAARASKGGKVANSVLVQAQYLRNHVPQDAAGPISGFAVTLENEALDLALCAHHGEQHRLESDVKRAIAAAEADLSSYRVEIGPDGTITLVVGAPVEGSSPEA